MVFLASDFYQKQPIWFQKKTNKDAPNQVKQSIFLSPWSPRFREQLDIELWIFRMSSLLYNKHYVALIILYQCCLLMFFAMIWPLGQRGWIIVVLHKKLCTQSSICIVYPQYVMHLHILNVMICNAYIMHITFCSLHDRKHTHSKNLYEICSEW